MRFLLHGNVPWAPTGYGIQLRMLGEQLRADGHDVAYSANWGLVGPPLDWHGFRVYGRGYEGNGNDLLPHHAVHWFLGEPGWIITCLDVWVIDHPALNELNVASWTPVDHYLPTGCQPGVFQYFERSGAVPIAMARFGEDMLRRPGLDPLYVPLSVDTSVYKPTPTFDRGEGPQNSRAILDLAEPVPDDAFVVGMVAMNKGWAKDRKGFNEAFRAFGAFDQLHPEANAHFYVHAENLGEAEGIDLINLAICAHIAPHKIHWAGGRHQYSYKLGYTDDMMAALYSAFDVLLAPSHGEGFGVPLIEAQACGTPCIASAFSSQTELVPDGCGWLVEGQPEWDPAHHAEYMQPYIFDVIEKLETAWKADLGAMAETCVAHAREYDTAVVYEKYWRPVIAELVKAPDELELEREPMPEFDTVAVLCPVKDRPANVAPLVESFLATTEGGEAKLYFIYEDDDLEERAAVFAAETLDRVKTISSFGAVSYAEKLNVGFEFTTEPWVLCIGDDVVLHDGWLDAARKLSDRYDIIGTNDSVNGVKNPRVASGAHADHFFVRRAYVDAYGASLNGPGVLAPEEYRHWFVDMEIVSLAKARGVFAPCLESVVEHRHPGYDGREDLRTADATYMLAVEHKDADREVWMVRLPFIEQQRTARRSL